MAESRVNILGEETEEITDLDAQLLCLRALRRAADSGDARAAAWWLSHHPSTSGTFSDAAVSHRIEKEVGARWVKALLAYGMHPREQQRFLLHMEVQGINADRELSGGGDYHEIIDLAERNIAARIVDIIRDTIDPPEAVDRLLRRLEAEGISTTAEAEG